MNSMRIYLVLVLFDMQYGLNMGLNRSPVLLVPGFMGSKLSYHNKEKDHSSVEQSSFSWKTLWVSILQFFSPKSFYKRFSLIYDKVTGEMVSSPDYVIRPPIFGEVDGIEYLADVRLFSDYYHDLIKMLKKDLGYQPGVDLFGAAYDFRFISTQQHFDEYSRNLTELIETSSVNIGRKVIIVSHSLGGPLIRRFIVSKSQEWKDKYVDLWFSVNGAFGGSVAAIGASLLGRTYIVPRFLEFSKLFKKILRTFPTTYYLFPAQNIYGQDYDVVNYNGVKLKLSQMKEIFTLYGEELPSMLYNNRYEIWENETIMGLKTYCFYTGGIKTIKTIGVNKNFLRKSNLDEYGDGDGMVNIESLESCKKFFSKEEEEADVEYHGGIDHLNVVKNQITIDRLKSLIQNLQV